MYLVIKRYENIIIFEIEMERNNKPINECTILLIYLPNFVYIFIVKVL